MSVSAETMTGAASSARTDSPSRLDAALQALGDRSAPFARLGLGEKVELLKACMRTTANVAEAWVAAGHRAKGLPENHSEEWLVGPVPTMRNLRLLAGTLDRLRRGRDPVPASQVTTRDDGRVVVDVFPTSAIDGALFTGFSVRQVMLPGWTREQVRQRAASFYRVQGHDGGISLILGAGNVSSIPPMDALYKLFAEGRVCVVKMNPVNEWSGPFLEAALSPLIERGYLRVVYGGREAGSYLVDHPDVADVHITGSNVTHDAIVWGPPGIERDRRLTDGTPRLQKPITSELGNVSPVCIVPARYTASQLAFMARNVAAMITNNASFNCNAAKLLVTSAGWGQRGAFMRQLNAVLSETPTRKAYYPGAFDRYATLTADRTNIERIGVATEDRLPWTVIADVDPSDIDDPIFSNEPFCALVAETQLPAKAPAAFLAEATLFVNDNVWGTLNAAIIIHPDHERSAEVGQALDQAVDELRYGTVAINHWPAVSYALTSPAWGGHPTSTLADVQSGMGWVHNTLLLEGIEKAVLRGPLVAFPKPAWFADHAHAAEIGRRLVDLERNPSWLKVPGLAVNGLLG